MLRPLPLVFLMMDFSGRFRHCSAQSLTVGVAGSRVVVGLHRVDGRGTLVDVFGRRCMDELCVKQAVRPAYIGYEADRAK